MSGGVSARELYVACVRLATIRTGEATRAVRIDGATATALDAGDVGALLADAAWRDHAARASGPTLDAATLDFAPLITRPDKIICVGLNYRSHILEMGHDLPDVPTLFAKYPSALIGARDDLRLPRVSSQVDWEAELAVVIGAPARYVSVDDARAAIAGYSVCNDVSMRDWQSRTLQWLQGKTFEACTPLGPGLVTLDELDDPDALDLSCEVDGEQMQKAVTSDLVFGPAALVSYCSNIFTLLPGDVISTGTPGGVGAARTPPRFLGDGSVVVTRIDGVGECRNRCRAEG
jgi:acylpyruvate hydrolase